MPITGNVEKSVTTDVKLHVGGRSVEHVRQFGDLPCRIG